ncbi:DUF1934 domain-containing protein [Paenibacillus alkaliterrae]|uniref:DUF1934 domain-containing protein n=1 Tax=Paenibacillus alkaliterrae TaxID=320909 RepID=UPI001F41B4C2|nr:DUF1934 domain-containing protein [Paenibacillus alkaliterrae]MCF2941423.1 DUF1934 domain-containing protein [Paenibacillus alkaliterrae]
MGESNKVRITLESVQDGSSYSHSYEGEWFRKAKSVFIRYSEPADEGNPKAGDVRTLLRYRPEELSIMRRGVIESEQLFTPGIRRTGYYRTPMTSFSLETDTSLLALEADSAAAEAAMDAGLPSQLPFTIEWQYEMHVSDQMSGRFHIRLHIQEEQYS